MVRRAARARRIDGDCAEVRLPSSGSPNRADDTEFRPRLSAFTGAVRADNRARCDVGHRWHPGIRGLAGRARAGLLRSGQPDPQGGGRHGDRNGHAQELRRRRVRRRGRGPHVRRDQPGHRRGDRPGARLRRGGRRPRGARRPGRAFETLGPHDARRALAGAAQARRRDRGARATRSPSSSRPTPASRCRRQGRRDPGDGRQPALLRGRRAQHGGQGGRRVPRGLHVVHPPRAGRRRRPDRAVELPADDGGVEDRPGARRRLHDRPQARPDDADDARCSSPSSRPRSSPRAC